MAFYCSAWLHVFRREACAAREHAEQAIALSIERGFVWPQAFAAALHGWALAEEGRAAEGIREIREGLASLEQMGHALWRPHQQGLLAEACARAGQIDEALDVIAKALESAGRTGDVEHAAELHRQQGESLLQQGAPEAAAEAEKCFGDAIEIARRQKAKSWELRAAMSLARLWRSQGRRKQARELLAPVYDWFTEGFDTPDLQDAKALLDTLV
jgi:predicted ATPase